MFLIEKNEQIPSRFKINDYLASTLQKVDSINNPPMRQERFETEKVDAKRGLRNPLPTMKIAPPTPSNPLGGVFGDSLRFVKGKGKIKSHNGIDLAAKVGDPILATHSGKVVLPYVYGQPNRDSEQKYPPNYDGDRDGAGNRIYVKTKDGYETAYWHLQAGNPIAINPRTGNVFKLGDSVEAGDTIGYVGITGNALPHVPHLHYGVRKGSKWLDPFDFIHAQIDSTDIVNLIP